jgi:hypothetical protein
LPEDRRDNPTWRHVAAQLEQAAAGVDVVDLGIALRLALMLEGLKSCTTATPSSLTSQTSWVSRYRAQAGIIRGCL